MHRINVVLALVLGIVIGYLAGISWDATGINYLRRYEAYITGLTIGTRSTMCFLTKNIKLMSAAAEKAAFDKRDREGWEHLMTCEDLQALEPHR